MITVILNGYKRGDNLNEQLAALEKQSVKPTEILLWYNHPGDESLINRDVGNYTKAAYSNYNFGVWSRFYYALNAKNPYICVFDDDTIPGELWLENCLVTMQKNNGLLGGRGQLYINPKPPENCSYHDEHSVFGWHLTNNRKVVEVDYVGHAWFFRKEWLSHYTRELPDPKYNNCGEDMHFSYMLQKYAGIKTYVPPHPDNNKQLWASTKPYYGLDQNALSISNAKSIEGVPFFTLMDEFFKEQRMKGWKLVNEK